MLQGDACINTTISDDREVEQEQLTIHYEPLEALGAGSAGPEEVPSRLACGRPDGWARADDDAGAGRHRLCAASGVPGIYGLYATIVPLLAYALFGPSRILVLGPDSSLAAVILAVVFPLSAGDPMRAVALASMMAVVSGLVCILIGLLRLGSSPSCSRSRSATAT